MAVKWAIETEKLVNAIIKDKFKRAPNALYVVYKLQTVEYRTIAVVHNTFINLS